MKRLAILVLALAAGACSGSNSTTAPTPTATASPTRIISVTGDLAFGNVTIGDTPSRTFTISNSGNATLTYTSISASGGTGTAGYAASPTSGSVSAGGSQTVTFRFSPTVAQFYSAVLTVVGDQTSGGAAINVSGTGVAPASAKFSLNGTITDGTSRGILPNITVSITAGTNVGASAVSDGSGTYAIAGLSAGTFTVSAGATGYQTTTQSVTASTNTRVDLVLQRTASPTPTPTPTPSPTPSPTPTPSVEYRITGTARRCSATYQNSTGGTNQSEVNIPFSYSWSGAQRNDFLYMSCQIDTGGDTGSITIGLYKNGALVQSATANGFPNIATVSGLY